MNAEKRVGTGIACIKIATDFDWLVPLSIAIFVVLVISAVFSIYCYLCLLSLQSLVKINLGLV